MSPEPMGRPDCDRSLAGFWISTILSLMVVLALAFAFSSCRTKKTAASTVSSMSETRDSGSVTAVSGSIDWRRLLLSWVADSTTLRLTADSIVTPGGVVIHNPSIDTSASGPRLDLAGESARSSADSVHAEAAGVSLSSSSAAEDSATDSVIVAEPPDWRTWIPLLLVVGAGAVGVWLSRRK